MRNRRDGRCGSWLARWGWLSLFEWRPRVRDGQAMTQGEAIEAGIFWPAGWGTPGLQGGPAGLGYSRHPQRHDMEHEPDRVGDPAGHVVCSPGRVRRGGGGRVSSGLHQILSGLASGSGRDWRQFAGVAS